MPTVTFNPLGKTVQVDSGTDLLSAAQQAGVVINSPCGTKGTCGKCVVRLIDGSLESKSSSILSPVAIQQGYIQACQTSVSEASAVIEIPALAQQPAAQFADLSENAKRIDNHLFPQEWQYGPLVVRKNCHVAEPSAGDGLSDLDRLLKAVKEKFGSKEVTCGLPVIKKLADTLRAERGKISITAAVDADIQVIDISEEITANPNFGIVVDIGTTTISVLLISLIDGKIIDGQTDYNDQLACGIDIISRITYAQNEARLQELQDRVLETINRLVKKTAGKNRLDPRELFSASMAGNTTMIHLLLGLKPEYIRLAPYVPTVHNIPPLRASTIGLDIFPDAPIHFSPAIGSYVGGDITAGLFCTDLVEDTEEISVFLDIGTNGELVIGNNEFALACACSAGPAFEGGNIGCGMRATEGAIEKVRIDPTTGIADCQVIGDIEPIGICGSGMISLLAGLHQTGWLDAAGKLDRQRNSSSIEINGRQAAYTINSRQTPAQGSPIRITELEIENIIRAKAAIFAAYSLLLKQVELSHENVSKFYIAGGFGHFLVLEDAIAIGLLPDIDRHKYKYIGNSSLMGSYMMLISEDFRKRQQELARRITYLDLSMDPDYMDQYTAAMFLPHTDLSLFPSKS